MSRNILSKLGLVTIVAALLIAAVGCSDNNPVISNANNSEEYASPSPAVDNQSSFATKGIVEKFDVDQRVIQFEGPQFSSTPNTVTVGREAQMVLRLGAEPIPFDFKYIEVGIALAVTGERSGSARIGNLFLLNSTSIIGIDQPSLSSEEAVAGERRYAGKIAKLDIDARVIQFTGSDFGTTSRTFYIAREAMLQTSPNRAAIPFDFKYVNIGDDVVLSGTPRAAGGADISLIQLNNQIDVLSGTDQPSLSGTAGDNVAADFSLKGVVAKFDVDQRYIQFEGSNFGTRVNSFTVDRDATMKLLPSQTEIPFNFKYIQIGTTLSVQGDLRTDGSRVATLVQVQSGNSQIATAGNSL